jgi:hypothetical protein
VCCLFLWVSCEWFLVEICLTEPLSTSLKSLYTIIVIFRFLHCGGSSAGCILLGSWGTWWQGHISRLSDSDQACGTRKTETSATRICKSSSTVITSSNSLQRLGWLAGSRRSWWGRSWIPESNGRSLIRFSSQINNKDLVTLFLMRVSWVLLPLPQYLPHQD